MMATHYFGALVTAALTVIQHNVRSSRALHSTLKKQNNNNSITITVYKTPNIDSNDMTVLALPSALKRGMFPC